MFHFTFLLVLSLPTSLNGVRSTVQLSDESSPQLRIHAMTFNAGNQIFKDDAHVFTDFIHKVLPGHDDVGNEADIVFMGFQEFEDNKYYMGKLIGSKKLWNDLTEREVTVLRQKASELFNTPEQILEIKDTLNKKMNKYTTIESHIERLKKHFIKREYGKLAEQESSNNRLSNAITNMGDIVRKYPLVDVRTLLAPIRTWSSNITKQLQRFRLDFPNLNLAPSAESSWDLFLDTFDTVADKEYSYDDKFRREQFVDGVEEWFIALQEVMQLYGEDDFGQSWIDGWRLCTQYLEALHNHMKNLIEDASTEQRILQEASNAIHDHEATLQSILTQWASNMDVRFEPQKFNSGYIDCQVANHLDTVLYAYVNPWSKWKISPVEHSSDACKKYEQKSRKNFGCNLNNNQARECGKVVNFLVFRIEHEGVVQRLCALNTHMSFKGAAEDRIKHIEKAMVETRKAHCQSVVFMGDFNTRMHCGNSNDDEDVAPFARSENSFKYLLDHVCRNSSPDSCSLKESGEVTQSWDEMTQILQRDTVSCYEPPTKTGKSWYSKGKTTKKNAWELKFAENPVKQHNFHEPDLPAFPPTYKLKGPHNLGSNNWYHCNEDMPEEACFINNDKKPKHNPGWTDRIIVKARSFVTTEYARRMISPLFGSDHAPVIARLRIGFD